MSNDTSERTGTQVTANTASQPVSCQMSLSDVATLVSTIQHPMYEALDSIIETHASVMMAVYPSDELRDASLVICSTVQQALITAIEDAGRLLSEEMKRRLPVA